MKYYKLLTKQGYPSYWWIEGKIYPEDFIKRANLKPILELQKQYPSDWQEVPAGDFYVQEGKMPEYFAIKRVADNPLWEKYIDWLNKTYNCTWSGDISHSYYGYADDNDSHGTLPSIKGFGEDAVELTLEQWNKIVNKKQEIMSEIIGWKLIKPEYIEATQKIANTTSDYTKTTFMTSSIAYNRFKEAGVLELWFKPVYKEEFKVGDWITIENSGELQAGCMGCKKGTYQVISKPTDDNWGGLDEDDNGFFVETFDKVWRISNIGVRLATPEEIKAAQTLKFGGYEVTFEKVTSGVRITCNGETGTFSQIEAIYNYFKPNSTYFKFGRQEVKEVEYSSGAAWNLEYEKEAAKSIKIGCTIGTWEELVAIYKKAKSML